MSASDINGQSYNVQLCSSSTQRVNLAIDGSNLNMVLMNGFPQTGMLRNLPLISAAVHSDTGVTVRIQQWSGEDSFIHLKCVN